jgi:hypothetical protein
LTKEWWRSRGECKAWCKEYNKEYQRKNADKIKKRAKDYYNKNSDKIKENAKINYKKKSDIKKQYQKEYQRKNADKIRRQKKEYAKENRERIQQRGKEYYRKNVNIIKEKDKQYRQKNASIITERKRKDKLKRKKNNPRFKYIEICRTRTVLIYKARGIKKNIKSLNLLGCTPQQLKEYLEKQFKPGMTHENHGLWHIDHIRPISSFSDEELHLAFHYTNLQPLWAEENLEKSNKWDSNNVKENKSSQ